MAGKKGKLVIAILDRGWIFVGRAKEMPSAITLDGAACIRSWGTTKGIGQLALEGPLKDTKLDEAGSLTVPRRSVIALIDVRESAWPGR